MASTRAAELTRALAALRDRVTRAAAPAGRDPEDIELLPVTKFFPVSDVIVLRNSGCSEFGESREQEAARKITSMQFTSTGDPIRWHMIGRIQRNKAKAVAGWAHTAHSVDSARLVTALDRAAADALADGTRTEPLRLYLQMSLDGDAARGGIDIEDRALVDEVSSAAESAEAVRLIGLMAIPPREADPDVAFARLQAERDRLQQRAGRPLGLSAGMSGDLEAAVRHGSTCLRVGTALMGPRPLTSP